MGKGIREQWGYHKGGELKGGDYVYQGKPKNNHQRTPDNGMSGSKQREEGKKVNS